MNAAMYCEVRKTAASTVVRSTTVLLLVGILGISVAMSLASAAGNEQVRAKLGPLADKQGWDQIIAMVSMVSAPAGLLAFGVVLSWIVGREFVDQTIGGLFALPVTLRQIVLAKLLVFWGWSAVVALAATLGCVVSGLALGYGLPGPGPVSDLCRLLGVLVLTGLLATPAAWAATLGRGVLPGIAVTVVMIALGQILVVLGSGAWFPVAAPALWAVLPDGASAVQLALVPAAAALVAVMTARSWHRLQLDR